MLYCLTIDTCRLSHLLCDALHLLVVSLDLGHQLLPLLLGAHLALLLLGLKLVLLLSQRPNLLLKC